MAKLRGEIPVRRHRLAQTTIILCVMRPRRPIVYYGPIFHISFPDRCFRSPPLDGRKQIGVGTGSFLCASFLIANATYISLLWELTDRAPVREGSVQYAGLCGSNRSRPYAVSRRLRAALKYPLAELVICICCLLVFSKARSAESWEAHLLGIKAALMLFRHEASTRLA
jgi:hypothetical protein